MARKRPLKHNCGRRPHARHIINKEAWKSVLDLCSDTPDYRTGRATTELLSSQARRRSKVWRRNTVHRASPALDAALTSSADTSSTDGLHAMHTSRQRLERGLWEGSARNSSVERQTSRRVTVASWEILQHGMPSSRWLLAHIIPVTQLKYQQASKEYNWMVGSAFNTKPITQHAPLMEVSIWRNAFEYLN